MLNKIVFLYKSTRIITVTSYSLMYLKQNFILLYNHMHTQNTEQTSFAPNTTKNKHPINLH